MGAVIADEEGHVIARGHNLHHQNNDPTSHGETQCVRNAGSFFYFLLFLFPIKLLTTIISMESGCKVYVVFDEFNAFQKKKLSAAKSISKANDR